MTTSEELELFHYGVKGMKWGVRKDRRTDSRIARAERVASGTGSTKDKVRELAKTSTLDFARAGGSLKKVSANRARKLTKKKTKREANSVKRERLNKEFDKRRSDYKASRTKGKKVTDALLMGTASIGYNSARASGATKKQAFVANFFAGPAGGMAYREIIRRTT